MRCFQSPMAVDNNKSQQSSIPPCAAQVNRVNIRVRTLWCTGLMPHHLSHLTLLHLVKNWDDKRWDILSNAMFEWTKVLTKSSWGNKSRQTSTKSKESQPMPLGHIGNMISRPSPLLHHVHWQRWNILPLSECTVGKERSPTIVEQIYRTRA